MDKRVIFFPKTLLETSDVRVELFGFDKFMTNVRYYFVLPNYVKNVYNAECEMQTIGHFTRTSCQSCAKHKESNALCVTEINGNLNACLFPGQVDNFVLVVYDPTRLYDYGTCFSYEGDLQKFICFTMLSKWLSSTKNEQNDDHVSKASVFQTFTEYLLIILNVLINSFGTNVMQLTLLRLTFFKHILGVLKNYKWLLESLVYNKQTLSRSKAVNYLMSCVCDALFGLSFLYLLNITFVSSNELFSYISSISHVIKSYHKFIAYIFWVLIMIILIYRKLSKCSRAHCNGLWVVQQA